MKTFDLRTIGNTKPIIEHAEFQQVTLKRGTWENEYLYYIATPDHPEMRRVHIEKSLRYASHSNTFGIAGPSLLQLSLAICLQLYSVSRSIVFHKEFAGKYLLDLPQGKFYVTVIVPL